MKKVLMLLVVGLVLTVAGTAFAQQCQYGVAITPPPAAEQSLVTSVEVHLVIGAVDEVAGTVGVAATSYQWNRAGTCPTGDEVYTKTVYQAGLSANSPRVAVQNVVGYLINAALHNGQP